MRAARALIETEELKPRPRQILRSLLDDFDRWRSRADRLSHDELAQLVLEESGYIDMWKAERTPDAAGRLDNLKELVRSMGEFPDLAAFLEHVSLIMDADRGDEGERVSIMTLHAAKGLEFDLVFLPGWEEGLFPNQRSLDDTGLAGLEEERRLAYVGLTRARRQARIYYALNRRVRGLWQASIPSRFIQELPADHIEVDEFAGSAADRAYGAWPSAGAAPGSVPATRRRAGAGPRRAVAIWMRPAGPPAGRQVRSSRAWRTGKLHPLPPSRPDRGCSTTSLARAPWSPWTAPN